MTANSSSSGGGRRNLAPYGIFGGLLLVLIFWARGCHNEHQVASVQTPAIVSQVVASEHNVAGGGTVPAGMNGIAVDEHGDPCPPLLVGVASTCHISASQGSDWVVLTPDIPAGLQFCLGVEGDLRKLFKSIQYRDAGFGLVHEVDLEHPDMKHARAVRFVPLQDMDLQYWMAKKGEDCVGKPIEKPDVDAQDTATPPAAPADAPAPDDSN